MKPSWNKDGLNFLGRLLILSNLELILLIEENKVRGNETNNIETINLKGIRQCLESLIITFVNITQETSWKLLVKRVLMLSTYL